MIGDIRVQHKIGNGSYFRDAEPSTVHAEYTGLSLTCRFTYILSSFSKVPQILQVEMLVSYLQNVLFPVLTQDIR
jgi:hypothetical protein